MPHKCAWPIDGEKNCDEPAHHCFNSDNRFAWLCTPHFDFIADLLKSVARDGHATSELMDIIWRNDL